MAAAFDRAGFAVATVCDVRTDWPPIAVPCPHRNLVAEWNTRSAP